MEDNSSNDEEVQEGTSSPQVSVKKLKMNDGSSQDSLTETASTSKAGNDEKIDEDTTASAEKSESTSTESAPVPAPESEPANEVVAAAPSTSNIHTILFNLRPHRIYRKRRIPGHSDMPGDSDSSTDSDDISGEDMATSTSRQTENSDDNDDPPEIDLQRFVDSLTDADDSGSGINLQSNEDTDSSYSDEVRMLSVDSDTEEEERPWSRDQDDESKSKTPPVLLKTRPKHNYLILKDIVNREMGLSSPANAHASCRAMNFEKRFYGSLHAVYRLKLAHKLQGHRGCVNAIDFHPEGRLLASGSDDMNVIVWDWARGAQRATLRTGHKANVFQSKFLFLNARSQLNIVTCARDGQVRLLQCPPSGGACSRRRLATHSRAALKLHVSARAPHDVISAGEDGLVLHADVRAEKANKLFIVKDKNKIVPLYSVHGHPTIPEQLAVAGRDRFVRVYDTRSAQRPLALYCPAAFTDNVNASRKNLRISMMHLTCAVYNHDGSEILASYNDEDIYLFDTKNDVYDKDSPKDGYTHRYSGHRNSATFKGVSYFGPGGQFVASGSDCAHLFLWHRDTEALVQWRKADVTGVVNCVETHPTVPVIATSGLDRDVKIWQPWAHLDVSYDGLEKVIRNNSVSHLRSPLFNDFLPTIYSAYAADRLLADDEREGANIAGNMFDGNVCTAF